MNSVEHFEKIVAEYYNSLYAIATDCCTHAIELCLRLTEPVYVKCPNHTYLSIPMTFSKLKLQWDFNDEQWQDYYTITNTNIILFKYLIRSPSKYTLSNTHSVLLSHAFNRFL